MLVKSDNFIHFQIFNIRLEFFEDFVQLGSARISLKASGTAAKYRRAIPIILPCFPSFLKILKLLNET